MLSAPTHTTAEPQIQSSVHQAHCVLEEHVTTSPPEILSTLARPQIFTLEHSVWSRRSSQSILTPTPAHVSAMDCLSLDPATTTYRRPARAPLAQLVMTTQLPTGAYKSKGKLTISETHRVVAVDPAARTPSVAPTLVYPSAMVASKVAPGAARAAKYASTTNAAKSAAALLMVRAEAREVEV